MYLELVKKSFKEREPIMKDELEKVLDIKNRNSLNQTISYMVSFGFLNRFENGIYYMPSSNEKFANLKPSIKDIIEKKYLNNYNGIRVGAYLLYKYKFSSQVSEYYEILSNNVSTHTRSKKEFLGKVIISYPKFTINKNSSNYIEFLELVKDIQLSDYQVDVNIKKLSKLYKSMNLNKEKLLEYSKYYKGNRLASIHKYIKEVINYEIA